MILTLETVGVQQVLAFLVALDATLGASHPLPGDAPQQTLTLGAVGGCSRCPHLEMMWRGGGDRINKSLQSLPQNLQLLHRQTAQPRGQRSPY